MSDIFKDYGIKKTGHRETVLKIIKESKIPMTAEDIFKSTDGMSLATVYRALEKFCESGVLTKISVGDDEKKYYEIASDTHRHYAVCLKCRHLEYIDFCPIGNISLKDFDVTGHRLELYGYCRKCREGKK